MQAALKSLSRKDKPRIIYLMHQVQTRPVMSSEQSPDVCNMATFYGTDIILGSQHNKI